MKTLVQRGLAWAAVAALLGAVFIAYRSPRLAVELANAVWGCF
jgi:hypothetical protein